MPFLQKLLGLAGGKSEAQRGGPEFRWPDHVAQLSPQQLLLQSTWTEPSLSWSWGLRLRQNWEGQRYKPGLALRSLQNSWGSDQVQASMVWAKGKAGTGWGPGSFPDARTVEPGVTLLPRESSVS